MRTTSVEGVARELVRLERSLTRLEMTMHAALRLVAPSRRESAKNLAHYVALRQHDLRDLQKNLASRGLSSLGRSESCVMRSVVETSARAHESLALANSTYAKTQLPRLAAASAASLSQDAANDCLHQSIREVLGPRPRGRHVYIMVTAPSAKEATRPWMVKVLRAGMNVLRINCAHEGEHEWAQTVLALREASVQTGRDCRILMDLAGPKIRTGVFANGRRIVTWKPTKDELGRVTVPARVVIHRASAPEAGEEPFLCMNDPELASIRKGDELRFRDARGKHRLLEIAAVEPDALIGLGRERVYVLERAHAKISRDGKRVGKVTLEVCAPRAGFISVKKGDELVLTRGAEGGTLAAPGGATHARDARVVTCTVPAALDHLAVGEPVVFDDGRIHTVVERATKERTAFFLRVVRTQKETVKLRAEKGINLPETRTTLPSLTRADRKALAFVVKHADAVSLSFVRTPRDVRMLHAALERLGASRLAVVLKIEKREAFENLPRLLLEGLRRPPLAVMVARGDLAVEVGFERLVELQDEILWMCEAAHVPAIWATQVLDGLARTGSPSRAEVTDAATSVTAECVMLNKGPFIDEAVRVLSDILGRMERHYNKKRSLLGKLRGSTFVALSPRRAPASARRSGRTP